MFYCVLLYFSRLLECKRARFCFTAGEPKFALKEVTRRARKENAPEYQDSNRPRLRVLANPHPACTLDLFPRDNAAVIDKNSKNQMRIEIKLY